jgi:hypothetical protein
MSRPIPRALAFSALVLTLFMSGVGLAVPATTGRADDCLAAPNSVAPQGSHWFYKLDPATKRKCWYVRAPGQTAQATRPKSPATSLHATPAPSGPTPAREAAPAPASPGDAAPPPAQIEMRAVKPAEPISSAAPEATAPPISTAPAAPANTSVEPSEPNVAPARNATPEAPPTTPAGKPPETSAEASAAPAPNDPPAIGITTYSQSAHQSNAVSIPTANPPPASTSSATGDQPSAPLTEKRAPLVKALGAAVPSNARTASVSNDAVRKASAGGPTNSSGMLIMVSIMLALGLALVGVIWRLIRKDIEWAGGKEACEELAAERRARIFPDVPELGPYNDPEFYRKLREGVAPQDPSINRPVKELL